MTALELESGPLNTQSLLPGRCVKENLLLNKEPNIDVLFLFHSRGATDFTSGESLFFCLGTHFNGGLFGHKRHSFGSCLKWGS